MAFLLRVVLPDRPGSLGALAAALGTVGADIEAIEVVERRPDGSAVDDVVVELPGQTMPEDLVSACARVPGVTVEWIARYSAGGSLFLDLEAVEEMTQQPDDALAVLVDLLPRAFRSDWAALVLDPGTGVLTVQYSSHTAPMLDGLDAPVMTRGRASRLRPPESWGAQRGADLVLAGARIIDADHVLLLGRGGGPDILDSELARLGHLAALATAIAGGSRDDAASGGGADTVPPAPDRPPRPADGDPTDLPDVPGEPEVPGEPGPDLPGGRDDRARTLDQDRDVPTPPPLSPSGRS